MTTRFTAIVEHGVLRPTTPVPLAEGAQVDVIVVDRVAATSARTPAEILAEIAALPLEPGGRPISGREHDQILYGERRTP